MREHSLAHRRQPSVKLVAVAVAAALACGLAAVALPTPRTATAEVICTAEICTTFNGKLTPRALPRSKSVPVRLNLHGDVKVGTTASAALPQLKRIVLAINRYGRLRFAGLPVCRGAEIRDAPSSKAFAACKDALVGTGRFGARLELPDQPTLLFNGKALVFNTRVRGKPGVLAHVFAREPTNLSITVPFVIRRVRRSHTTYGTILRSPSLPRLLGDEVYATSFAFNLGRRYTVNGRKRSYLSAACPTPKGFPSTVFNLARATYDFTSGKRVTDTLARVCRVRRR